MDNLTFKANININKSAIKQAVKSDKNIGLNTQKSLDNTLKQVENLSTMKEKSNVYITPRIDKGNLNLICNVKDSSNDISVYVSERSGRKIATNSNFALRFVSGIINAIKNVDTTRKNIKQINKIIKNSKTLEDKNFVNSLKYYLPECLNKGYNPTKRIISVLKKIDKEYSNEKNIISIEHVKSLSKNGTIYTKSAFVIRNSQKERSIPLFSLLKDPSEKLFA